MSGNHDTNPVLLNWDDGMMFQICNILLKNMDTDLSVLECEKIHNSDYSPMGFFP